MLPIKHATIQASEAKREALAASLQNMVDMVAEVEVRLDDIIC